MDINTIAYRNTEMFAPRRLHVEKRADGSLILRSPIETRPPGRSVCDYLPDWAEKAPDRLFLAERSVAGGWRTLTYAQAWSATASIGESLLEMGIEPRDRVAILSGNSIDHALIMLGGMSIGCVVSAISPNYSLLPGGTARLSEIGRVLKPSLVFAQSAQVFAAARTVPELAAARWISGSEADDCIPIAQLLSTLPGPRFRQAFEALRADAPAKILFTSGSTGAPKGVINTHGMLTSALESVALVVEAPEAPVQVEWLPWHHTMGGNATFNGIMRNGGTHYIDDGRPTPQLFPKTLANLQEISPTSMLNVPAAYVMLVDALERDPVLRDRFFKDLRSVTYGGASIPAATIERFQTLAVEAVGARIPVLSGYGATEAAPTICVTHWPSEQSGELGLPMPGLALKMIPEGDRYRLLIKGPNVTPGYYGRPELNAEVFDEEGFYMVGDLVSFVDPSNPEQGLLFGGRVAENFKLSNGTWVVPDQVRKNLVGLAGGALQDVVVAGENRNSITVLLWPSLLGAGRYVKDRSNLAEPRLLAVDEGLIEHLRKIVAIHNSACGSSSGVSAFSVMGEPPSLGNGELTDKSSINQRAALGNRSQAVEAMYIRPLPADVFEPA